MNPGTLHLIANALTRYADEGVLFSSRTQLSEHVAVSTGLSSRTVRRAFSGPDGLEVDHLIGTPAVPPENGVPPGVGQNHRTESDSSRTGRTAKHETPAQSTSTDDASRAPAPGRTQLTSGPPAPPATPPPPPSSPPAPGPQSGDDPPVDVFAEMVSKAMRPVRRKRNKFPGYCLSCEYWVDVNEGFLRLPYTQREETPLYCAECFGLYDFLDRQMATPDPGDLQT